MPYFDLAGGARPLTEEPVGRAEESTMSPTSEAERFWSNFLRSLMRRGLRGMKLVISDAHEGLKAATDKVLKATGG